MLTIRMQRTGRSGHAQFRVVVQDRRFSPKRGRVTAYVGSYDPHTKAAILDKDKIESYLKNGAQPSDRVAKLLQKEGLKLPDWVVLDGQKQRAIRKPEKLRRNRPEGAEAPVAVADETAEASLAAEAESAPAETEASAEVATEEPAAPAEEADKAPETEAEASKPAAETAEPEVAAPAKEATPEEAAAETTEAAPVEDAKTDA